MQRKVNFLCSSLQLVLSSLTSESNWSHCSVTCFLNILQDSFHSILDAQSTRESAFKNYYSSFGKAVRFFWLFDGAGKGLQPPGALWWRFQTSSQPWAPNSDWVCQTFSVSCWRHQHPHTCCPRINHSDHMTSKTVLQRPRRAKRKYWPVKN